MALTPLQIYNNQLLAANKKKTVVKPKPAATVAAPKPVRSFDPYNATADELAKYQYGIASAGPDYSQIQAPDFEALRNAANTQARNDVLPQAQRIQDERGYQNAREAVSKQAAANFAAAFGQILGGGNANPDDPAAQAFSLANYGGSYLGGMAAAMGAQLIATQSHSFDEQDAKLASAYADKMDEIPGLADKVYNDLASQAQDWLKEQRSIVDADYQTQIKALASLITARRASEKSGGGVGGLGKTTKVGGSLYTQDPKTGKWTLTVAAPAKAAGSQRLSYTKDAAGNLVAFNPYTGQSAIVNPKGWVLKPPKGAAQAKAPTVKTDKAGRPYILKNGKIQLLDIPPGFTTKPPGTSPSGSNFSSAQYARAVKVGVAALQAGANNFIKGAVAYADKRKWDDAQTEKFIAAKTNGYFKTWMSEVTKAIAPHLRDMGYTQAQITAEAFKIVSSPVKLANGDTIAVKPPAGYKVPKAKPVSLNTSEKVQGSQYANYTAPPPPDSVVYAQYKNSRPIPDEQLVAVLRQAGFTGKGLQYAYSIAKRESGGNPLAFNPNRQTQDLSWGLFQINTLGSLSGRVKQFGLQSPMQLLDPLTNAKAAFRMSEGGTNWYHWGVDTGKGAYRDAHVTMLPLPGSV